VPHTNCSKEVLQDILGEGDIISLVTLDVQGAFNAACWPTVLQELKDYGRLQISSNVQRTPLQNVQRLWQRTAYDWRKS